MTTATDRKMRVVVCDDDDRLRSVISDLVEHVGAEVLAETDSSYDTVAVIDGFHPDLVILDMALGTGTGMTVLEDLSQRPSPPAVIVFTSFDVVAAVPAGTRVIHKPDLLGLEQAMETVRDSLGAFRA